MNINPTLPWLLAKPYRLLAFGFASGLAPKAPGTAGTLAALPLVLLCSTFNSTIFFIITLIISLVGCWLCELTSRDLKVHDHPGIVWDEFAGMFITMLFLPINWLTLTLGFAIFRFFDIVKPWPISLLDKKVKGGIGIMADDCLAGIFSFVTLQTIHGFFNLS